MAKILFPTNFKESSLNAFQYAVEYAKVSNSDMVVFHAFNEKDAKHDVNEFFSAENVNSFRDHTDSYPPFPKLLEAYDATSLNVSYVVEKGDFVSTLKEYVDQEDNAIDLIFMGTRSIRSKFLEFFVEKQSEKVLKELKKLVVVVPEKSKFVGKFDKLILLVNYKEDELEVLQHFFDQFNIPQLEVHFVHFDLAHVEDHSKRMSNFSEKINLPKGYSVVTSIVDTIDLKKSLSVYVTANQIDLVGVLNREHKDILFQENMAQELIENMDIPVLSIYHNNEPA